jgi:L-aspartate oxidase
VHGANRLASNSMLDGLVFAPRAVDAIAAGRDRCEPTGVLHGVPAETVRPAPDAAPPAGMTLDGLQRLMTANAGVLRDRASLDAAIDRLAPTAEAAASASRPAAEELRNLVTVGRALALAARAREESRGTHTRLDHPETRSRFLGRFVLDGAEPVFSPLPADVREPSR